MPESEADRAHGWRPNLAPSATLRARGIDSAELVLDPGGTVQLNACAGAILELCDGSRSANEVVTAISRGGAPKCAPETDVRQFLDVAATLGWIVNGAARTAEGDRAKSPAGNPRVRAR